MEQLTPHQIVNELDRYIVGQNKAKKAVAIALRNRYRRSKLDEKSREDICYEYGVTSLDSVDCNILLSLETDEKRNAYLKKRFPEGT